MNFRALLGPAALGWLLLAAPVRGAEPTTRSAGAELITLRVMDQPAEAAFNMLGEKIGCTFRGQNPALWENVRNAPVLTNFDQQPFWAIVRELCRQAGVQPVESFQRQVLLTQDQNSRWAALPAFVGGPIRVTVINADLGRHRLKESTRLAKGKGSGMLQLQFLSDPRIPSVFMTPLKVQSVVSEDGKPVALARPFKLNEAFSHGSADILVQLDRSAHTRQLQLFKASTDVVIVSRIVPIEIRNIAATPKLEKKIGDLTFTIMTTPFGGGARILARTQNNPPSPQWDRLSECFPRMPTHLYDKQGHEYKLNRVSGGGWGQGGADGEWEFVGVATSAGMPSGPDRFTWEVPVDTVTLPLSIEFKNLTLF